MHERIVKFYWASPRDIIAMTHADQFPNDKFPAGIPSLVGTPIDNQLAMMAMVRDERDNIIGVLSELEVFGRKDEMEFEVNLTMVMPARGAPYKIAAEKGEWSGRADVLHTSGPLPGRCGVVIGGTGEFAGMTGRHQQTAIYKHIKGNVTVVEVCETFWLVPSTT
jgi:hypothetical protein